MSPRVASLSSQSCHRHLGWLRPALGGLALCFTLGLGCGDSGGGGGTGGSHQGGSGGLTTPGGATASGGATSAGGTVGSGGSVVAGGSIGTGGKSATGGSTGTGGVVSTGGAADTGGTKGTGGSTSGSGGSVAAGGSTGAGGTVSTGGASDTGGTKGTGGSTSAGGSTASGGGSGSGGSSAGGSGTGGSGAGGSSGSGDGGTASAVPSAGCGKTPTLKNSPTATANQNAIGSRQFVIRWPSNYDNTHPYRLILDFHGAGGSDTEEAPSYFGLFDLSNNTTIFAAPSASGGIWDATADLTFVDAILKAVEADLCIDTSRIMLEGFSQGGAMVATLACSRPGVFRAAVGHSRGGLAAPTTCQPIPYLGSLGLSDISGNSQATQTDPFAKWNGCTITTMPLAKTGSHVCQNYTGCPAADPVIWCSFDGPHTASPTDSGKSTSWMPSEVWPFLSQF